ncbi:MAG: hypothetical protein IT310_08765 [Anaerolineales bacterium]|nr:hypothetical protein [Anaerolineales bacterium]
MATIIFNGKTYNSLEEMSPEMRQAYEQITGALVDKNGNGIPDFLEGDVLKNITSAYTSAINLNGQTYNNLNELPPEARQRVQNALEKVNQLGLAGPERKAEIFAERQGLEVERDHQFTSQPYRPAGSAPSAIQDGSAAPKWLLLLAVLFVCLMAGACAIFFFLQPQ